MTLGSDRTSLDVVGATIMPHGTATCGISSFLLDYYIGACFTQAERKGYRGAELAKLRWVLVVTRAELPHEFYVNPPRRVDPDVYPDEEPEHQSS